MSETRFSEIREIRIEEMMSFELYPNADTSGRSIGGEPYIKTIGEAADFAFDETDIPEILIGALPVEKDLDLSIKERRIADLIAYVKVGYSAGPSSTAARRIVTGNITAGVPFTEEQHIKAFGYSWYSILNFTLNDGELKYLLPWGQTWYKGGAPFPRAYTIGNPDRNTVSNIIHELCSS
jgi:hypothetical protein